jgi:predicted lipoprotein with Yx(FWY)xxD motif
LFQLGDGWWRHAAYRESHQRHADRSAGLTLYTFDRDPANGGKSVCNGMCSTNWPPLLAEPGKSASGDYSIITRDDGTRQWAYKGKPLYRFAKDAKAGDKSGDNFNAVWHAAMP